MERFIGRNAEINYLNQYYEKQNSNIVVVYGSKGVGKTRLIREFCKDKDFFYYHARECSDREQCFQWYHEIKKEDAILTQDISFNMLLTQSVSDNRGTKQVLVIDEFHNMMKGNAVFFSDLLEFLSKDVNHNIFVILSTSASGWVENRLVSTLRNRAAYIGGFLKLRELDFSDMRKIYPKYNLDNAIMIFSVLGGIPGYWNCFSEGLNAVDNIVTHLIEKESRLYGEMDIFLEKELREPSVYNTILVSLANDYNKLNDIYKITGYSRAKISVYLKNLMELDLVEKVYSFDTEGRANTRKGIYRISNPYIKFYYRYLFSHISLLELVSAKDFFEEIIRPTFSAFVEEGYKSICREQMRKEFKMIGEWLGKTGTLDIVCGNQADDIKVAICSYYGPLTKERYEDVLKQLKIAKIHTEDIRLFSPYGVVELLLPDVESGKIKLMNI